MDEESDAMIDQHMFKFTEQGKVTYERKVNGNELDGEIEHSIEESELESSLGQSWTESLFYGIGNKAM